MAYSSPWSVQDNEAKRMWFASILFIARNLHGAGDGSVLPLTKILQEFSIWCACTRAWIVPLTRDEKESCIALATWREARPASGTWGA